MIATLPSPPLTYVPLTSYVVQIVNQSSTVTDSDVIHLAAGLAKYTVKLRKDWKLVQPIVVSPTPVESADLTLYILDGVPAEWKIPESAVGFHWLTYAVVDMSKVWSLWGDLRPDGSLVGDSLSSVASHEVAEAIVKRFVDVEVCDDLHTTFQINGMAMSKYLTPKQVWR